MKASHTLAILLAIAAVSSGCKSSRSGGTAGNSDQFRGQSITTQEVLVMPGKGDTSLIRPQGGPYHPEATRYFDLIHTKLELEPIWEAAQLKGVAQITATPHFYPQSRLVLDAKGFEVRSVQKVSGKKTSPLVFKYDGQKLDIALDSNYTKGKRCTVEIEYTAKPNELKSPGKLEAITSDKGLYFINEKGTVPGRAKQLWTQGEPESNSCWFPTIEATNQKMTQEISLTVDTSMVTLSNGTLAYSSKQAGGKRTDVWEMKQPHAPYLAMIAAGPFAVVKDKWRGIDVDYYVEKPFRKDAKAIFGRTPEMIEFFSEKMKLPFVWPKYSQIVVRDYVSGAMENTTAVTFMEEMYIDDQTRLDSDWDYVVAHELFHHWFGDLATCENWSQLSLNESFANYSEFLWAEHKLGRDEADLVGRGELFQYLYESSYKQEPIIRHQYKSPNDMFDSHSYAKGGRVLHMLRNEVGDEAFFESLHQYLKKFSFKKAEIQDLRLVFEEVTGRDLEWFFDQWWLKPGHPEIKLRKNWDGEQVLVSVSQLQNTTYTPLYRLPITVDVWYGGRRERHVLTTTQRDTTFAFPAKTQPSLVEVDPERVLLGTIDFPMSEEEHLHRFTFSNRALNRSVALSQLLETKNPAAANVYFQKALKDSSYIVRKAALELSLRPNLDLDDPSRDMIAALAASDPKASVREAAVGSVGQLRIGDYASILGKALSDKSYAVQAEALTQYAQTKSKDIDQRLKEKENSPGIVVQRVVAELYGTEAKAENLAWLKAHIYHPVKYVQTSAIKSLGEFASKAQGETRFQAMALLNELSTHVAGSGAITEGLRAAMKYLKEDPDAQTIRQRLPKA